MLNTLLKPFGWLLRRFGYTVRFETTMPEKYRGIPDAHLYQPLFSPWMASGEFDDEYARISDHTLVSRDRCWVLNRLAKQSIHLEGCFVECGVFRGGTAMMLSGLLAQAAPKRQLFLFDTFQGMPETQEGIDLHKAGDFAETSAEHVASRVGHTDFVTLYPGWIPETFKGLESTVIAFAHIDVDVYDSILDCCAFIYPRLKSGGCIVFDDYGFASCPGARQAVDEFFAGKPEEPLCLMTGQAIVFKL